MTTANDITFESTRIGKHRGLLAAGDLNTHLKTTSRKCRSWSEYDRLNVSVIEAIHLAEQAGAQVSRIDPESGHARLVTVRTIAGLQKITAIDVFTGTPTDISGSVDIVTNKINTAPSWKDGFHVTFPAKDQDRDVINKVITAFTNHHGARPSAYATFRGTIHVRTYGYQA